VGTPRARLWTDHSAVDGLLWSCRRAWSRDHARAMVSLRSRMKSGYSERSLTGAGHENAAGRLWRRNSDFRWKTACIKRWRHGVWPGLANRLNPVPVWEGWMEEVGLSDEKYWDSQPVFSLYLCCKVRANEFFETNCRASVDTNCYSDLTYN